jgi:hypothetical protein
VILVLGCTIYGGEPGEPSPCIRARADHAAALYRQGLAARSRRPALLGARG